MDSIGIFAPGVHSVRVEVGGHQYELFDERKLSAAKARRVAVALAGWLGLHRDDPARALEPRFARRVRRELLRFCGAVGLSSAALRAARVQVAGATEATPAAPNGYGPLLSVAVGSVLPRLVVEYRRAHPQYGRSALQSDSVRGPYFARLTNGRATSKKGPDEPTDLEPPAVRYERADPHDWDAVERAGGGDCESI